MNQKKLQCDNKILHQQPVPGNIKEVFELFYNPLCAFATRYVGDVALAQDIASEVFLKGWDKRDNFQSMYSLKAFLFISTKNSSINYVQKGEYHRRAKREILNHSSEFEDELICEFAYDEVLKGINDMINSLPPKCRQVVMLSYYKGLNNQVISEIMKISVHTIRNQKKRAILLIKKHPSYNLIKGKWLDANN